MRFLSVWKTRFTNRTVPLCVWANNVAYVRSQHLTTYGQRYHYHNIRNEAQYSAYHSLTLFEKIPLHGALKYYKYLPLFVTYYSRLNWENAEQISKVTFSVSIFMRWIVLTITRNIVIFPLTTYLNPYFWSHCESVTCLTPSVRRTKKTCMQISIIFIGYQHIM